MKRNNNNYRDLINNKFSELLSADMDATWKQMKVILDEKIPEKKKRKWLLWFITRAGIIFTVSFSLLVSAAGAYTYISRDKQENNSPAPEKEIKNEINAEMIEETLNNSQKKININAENETEAPFPAVSRKMKDKGTVLTSGKNNISFAPVKSPVLAEQIKDTIVVKVTAAINIAAIDSIGISAETAQTEVVERRRAF